ncbi:hypothetical protein FR943_12860 [Mycobacterium sp. TNTM28]|uniref:Uncharacterized protein n=1 Tax=[Mycobacterium] fortunisiensis TaxID=2600579 RepID=A0ABS6KMI8_9MYCO|nr:hypothetical protein [[Mycobacterium] fortunisiensis]MBU9764735.1 hypothetical protein [[Mycobacterium] fortunisiensis]
MVADGAPQAHSREYSLPRFSTVEKHGRITVPVSEPSETLRLFAVLSFVLWMVVTVWAAFCFHALSHPPPPPPWQFMAMLLATFAPAIVTDILADEARRTFGQHRTGTQIALLTALAGVAFGLLEAALWLRGTTGGILALLSIGCTAVAAIATGAAWRGIRYTRARQDRLAALRRHGVRSPGELRNVNFLDRWTADDPQFSVTVAFESPTGRRAVTANMIAHHSRVPLPGAAVVVFSAPRDASDDVLIELDPDRPARLDRDPSRRYRKPTGS